jgi:DNA-binding MarR family transcriptional regulator
MRSGPVAADSDDLGIWLPPRAAPDGRSVDTNYVTYYVIGDVSGDRMTDFVESIGLPLFAHRLRRLSEALVDGCGTWLPMAGVRAPPKSGSTLMLLAEEGPLSITQIAVRLRLTHPLIIKLTREIEHLGLVRIDQDASDGRRRLVSLTAAGRQQATRLAAANGQVARAYRQLFDEAGVDAYAALVAVERALADRDIASRLAELESLPAT